MDVNNTIKLLRQRELKDSTTLAFQRKLHITDNLVARLGLEAELEGHSGCVNCLEWNEKGDLLASGSDDVHIILWDPFRHKKLQTYQTGHNGNIFSIKFLPNSNDGVLISGAADSKIRVHDLNMKETTQVCYCHAGRVKRIATAPNVPFMFWSAAEDGLIMQFDMRVAHGCTNTCSNVLINLLNHMGKGAEAKCLAINPSRPEMLAVGANDAYVRLYDRRMITPTTIKHHPDPHSRSPWDRVSLYDRPLPRTPEEGADEDNLPPGCTQYFVAGHLPIKQMDYKKRYRTLASTYMTFSPDGSELLVNLGGEQIYLFDVNRPTRPCTLDIKDLFATANGYSKEACGNNGKYNIFHPHWSGSTSNGITTNGVTTNGITNGVTRHFTSVPISTNEIGSPEKKIKYSPTKPLPARAEVLKLQANAVFEKQQYAFAITLYNEAIHEAPDATILYANRAAAYMKRGWDGDLYSALRDCYTALGQDHNHLKAHFRLARCLFELNWAKEANDCLQVFKAKFPDYAQSHACTALDKDINAAIFSRSETESEAGFGPKATSTPCNRKPSISEQENIWRNLAFDYDNRYCGHCNTTTDIKEANFFGSSGQYVIAGSDDGSIFIWDRITTNIVRVLRGDDSIVNCLQPHPTCCLLATSGIDPVVRLWSPKPEDGQKDEREVADADDAASANQKRMNADPLEVMLMNMGYRIRGVLDADDDIPVLETSSGGNPAGRETAEVQCRPS